LISTLKILQTLFIVKKNVSLQQSALSNAVTLHLYRKQKTNKVDYEN